MRALTAASEEQAIRRLAGGKGRNLFELTRSGIDVPAWAVIGSDVFAEFLERLGLADQLNKLLEGAGNDNLLDISQAAGELIISGLVPDGLAEVMREAYEHAGDGRVAVRSSGAEEDGADLSYAGQFSSYLNIEGIDQVVARVKECWASAYSERALHYRLANDIAPRPGGMAVVVQRLVSAQVSGVLFSANPVNGRRDECLISSVYGLGEGLVSGTVDADTLVVSRDTGAVRETVIGEKAQRYQAGEGQGSIMLSEVPASMRERLSIGIDQIEALRSVAARITEDFEAPQDIEWAFADGKLWILQSRPITALPETAAQTAPDGKLHIWDNSNIIESYSGIVSPLTYSFAKTVYAQVYRKYAEALGVPPEQLEQMDEWLPCMLGYVNGRVYYNLLHWYRMVRLAPLYRMNRKVLEKTIGVEESLDDELAAQIYPFTFGSRRRAWPYRIKTAAAFTWRYLAIRRRVNRFLRDFDRASAEFEQTDCQNLPADEAFRKFQRLQRELIAKWGPVMVLDASILMSLGALHIVTRRWLPGAPDWFTWAIGSPHENLESAEPAYRLGELAARVRADPDLQQLITETPDERAYEAIGGFHEFREEVDAYISRYGYRSLDDLKLEVPDLQEDRSGFFAMLRSALPETEAPERSDAAEDYLSTHLKGPKRWLYEIVRRKTRSTLSDRERLRFARTRAFGMAKRLLRAVGRDLARIGAIDDWQDIFLLRLEEIRGCLDGTIMHSELKPLIEIRRKLQEENQTRKAPPRFRTYGPVYWGGNLDSWLAVAAAKQERKELTGRGSCPGKAEGRAKVVDRPHDLGGDILVTYRTDPGWVPMLTTASALLIERGSPVTHVAVVARELGIPTVVQVPGLTDRIKTGMRLSVDGAAGRILIMEDEP